MKNYGLRIGLALGITTLASANTVVTFQVDMSVAIANAIYTPGPQSIAVHGSFNGWNAFALTNNPNGANTNLYTGTVNVASNGVPLSYKYTIEPGTTWEMVQNGNRLVMLPTTSGAALTVPLVYFGDNTPTAPSTANVTFRVDLAQQIRIGKFDTGSDTVLARGWFNYWGSDLALTNDPSIRITNQSGLVTSNVYVGTYLVSGVPGQTIGYKFYTANAGRWEDPSAAQGDPDNNFNRFFNFSTSPQTLPVVYFSDVPFALVATNSVTFQVDLSGEVLAGKFDPAYGNVDVRGIFNNWAGGVNLCTNNPAGANTNLYSTTIPIVDGVGVAEQYKFAYTSPFVPSGTRWELLVPAVPQIGGNRYFGLSNALTQTLPSVFFNGVATNDLLTANTLVTFTVNMTNAVGTDAHVFDPNSDSVFLNGDFLPWWSWPYAPYSYQMMNDPIGSELYTITLTLPIGNSLALDYKYSINGYDNEAGFLQDHVRYIRAVTNYTLPLDKFGTQLVEPSFGNLAVGRPVTNRVLVSWLGRPGVHLQTRTNLTAGSWQDLLATDGLSSTNYPTTAKQTFFRLIRP